MADDVMPDDEVAARFRARFGAHPTHVASAPGRVNIIGEHTDYSGGFALPCAIGFRATVALRQREDDQVNVIAADYDNQRSSFSVAEPIVPDSQMPWADYLRGVFWALLEQGHALTGMDVWVTSDVPQGAGLSSSAAVEVALALAIDSANNLGLSRLDLAQTGQQAENDFVGCRSGIMDQLASATARAGHAILLDCRALTVEPIPFPMGVSVVIVNSNVRRGLVASAYNDRRAACEEAASQLGVPLLRDVSPEMLDGSKGVLPDRLYRRARHVVSENARTLSAAQALEQGDLSRLSALMKQSHLSLRDDFEVTVPAVDCLVDIIDGVIGTKGGVRMTGGGFGGCVVAIVPDALVAPVMDAVASQYTVATGLVANSFTTTPADGAVVHTALKIRKSP